MKDTKCTQNFVEGLLNTGHFEDQDIFMKVEFFLFDGYPASEICADVSEQHSETSALKIQTPGNHAKERIQHSRHGDSFKSRLFMKAPP